MTIAVFVVGLILGVFLGREIDDLVRAVREGWNAKESDVVVVDKPGGGLRLSRTAVRLFALLIAMQVSVGVMQIVTYAKTQDFSQCVGDYTQQFAVGYRERVAASTETSTAMDEIVRTVASQDRAAFRKAVENYVTTREKQIKAQATNPLPPLPSTFCGADLGGKKK